MPATPAIVVEDLSFRYLGRKQPALRNVSFAVETGETVLVLGPSGGGKSTLALALDGLIPHRITGELSGRVRVADRDTQSTPLAELTRTVGLVFQDPDAQFCMARVDDEIAFGLENLRVPSADMTPRIRGALDRVGLAGHERSEIDRLSGGTRQRVSVAAVLAMEPPVLVFDEPTSNLDSRGADEVLAIIAELKRSGDRTLVIVEHRLDQLIGLVDRVLVLGLDGSVIANGAPSDVLRRHAADLASIGVWIPQVSDIANRLIDRGEKVQPYPITIDRGADVFGRLIQSYCQPRAAREPRPVDSRSVVSRSTAATSTDNAAESEPAVEITHLSYHYRSGPVGLRDVNLTIPRGAFVAVVGPNGAGKSTLARHLIGSIKPPTGAVRVLGNDVRATPVSRLARLVGYVFQNPEHQFVATTVFEELAFGLRLRGESEDSIRGQVDLMLNKFGLAALARAHPFTLSHGEKRRLSVATMLILGQKVLVLDEPTFGQDRASTDALMRELVALNGAGTTIVMITHDPRLVAEYADLVVALVEGSVAFAGSPEALFADRSLVREARLTLPPVRELAERLAESDPSFPLVAKVDDFVDALRSRVRPAANIQATPDNGRLANGKPARQGLNAGVQRDAGFVATSDFALGKTKGGQQ